MTVFLGSPVLTTVAPLVSPDKGSLGNRINCAGSQFLNAAATGLGVGATVGAADYAVKHKEQIGKVASKIKGFVNKFENSTIGKKVTGYIKSFAEKIKNSGLIQKLNNSKVMNIAKQAGNAVKHFIKTAATKISKLCTKLPKGGKIGLAIALGAVVLNGIYKSGQIDQKYTDRAKMEKNLV